MLATSNVALGLSPDAVLLLGDNQYENGALVWDRVEGATSYWVLEAYGDPLVYRQYVVRGMSMAVARRSSAYCPQ